MSTRTNSLKQPERWLLYTVVILAVAVCSFLLSQVLAVQHFHWQTSLRWDPYALPILIATLFDLALLIILLSLRYKEPPVLWFTFFVTSLTWWGVFETMRALSATPALAAEFTLILNIGAVALGPIFLVFAILYSENAQLLESAVFDISLFLTSLFLLYIITGTSLTHDKNLQAVHTIVSGYVVKLGPDFPIWLLWIDGLLISAYILLFRYYKRVHNPVTRRQAFIIMSAVLFPTLGGSITDGVLPAFVHQDMPLVVVLSSLMALIIGYAIIKDGLFVVNPASVASIILQTMGEAVLVTDGQFRVQFVNQGAEKLLGYQEEQVKGLHLEKVVGSSLFQQLTQKLSHQKQTGGQVKIGDTVIQSAHNHPIPITLSVGAVKTERRRISGYVLVLTDVTSLKYSLEELEKKTVQLEEKQSELEIEKKSVERKVAERTEELRKAQAELLASITSLSVGFILVDPQGRPIITNPSAQRILGKEAGHQLPTVGDLDLVKYCKKVQAEKEILTFDSLSWKDQFLRVLIAPVMPKLEQDAIAAVVLVEDITESKVIERSKDEFFSIASHELRTPIAIILGYIDTIRHVADEEERAAYQNYLDRIEGAGQRMNKIVNDFLNISRLEQGKIEYNTKTIDLLPVVRKVYQEMGILAKHKGLRLQIEAEDQEYLAKVDPDRLEEVITNLVSNSLKFTEKGHITLSLKKNKKGWQLRVTDTGEGISGKNQALLFHKFQQASDNILTRGPAQSSGLGLYISRLIIRQMGGDLTLESSEEGKGATFVVTIPEG